MSPPRILHVNRNIESIPRPANILLGGSIGNAAGEKRPAIIPKTGEGLSRSPWLVIPGNPRPVVRAEWDRRQSGSIVKSRRRVGLPGIAGGLRIRNHWR